MVRLGVITQDNMGIPTPQEHASDDQKYWESRATFPSSHDIADRLPDSARARLIGLREELKGARWMVSAVFEDLQVAREKRDHLETAIKELSKFGYAENHARMVVERKSLAEAQGELKRIGEKYAERSGRAQSFQALIGNIERYLQGHSEKIVIALPHAFTLPQGVPLQEALDGKRREIQDLRKKILATKNAPIPAADAKRMAREWVERLAESGRIDVAPLLERRGTPVLAVLGSIEAFSHGTRSQREIPNAAGLIAWIHRKALIAALDVEIDLHADDGRALSDANQKTQLLELKKDMLRAERDEESLIEMATAQGGQIERRPDADPRAILGLSGEMPEARRVGS